MTHRLATTPFDELGKDASASFELAVLIPVYQNQSGVVKSLEALRDATWPVVGTVILVDDGSNPALEIRSEDWAPLKLTRIRLQTNQGVEAALNAGLEFALKAGIKYIARLDAGDTIHKSRLVRQIAIMEADLGVGMVGSDVNFENEQGQFLFRFIAPRTDRAIRRRMHIGLCLIDPSVMFRASHFAQLGAYTAAYPAAEGYEIAFRFLSVSQAQCVPEPLTYTTLESKGLSITRRRDQLHSRLRIQLRYFDALELNSFIGIAATLIIFVVPRAAILKLKRMIGRSPV